MTRTREFLPTFARDDLDGLGEFFSDDVVWHVAGRHPLAGDHRGKPELLAYFARARDESADR